jgi:hypothetical protein
MEGQERYDIVGLYGIRQYGIEYPGTVVVMNNFWRYIDMNSTFPGIWMSGLLNSASTG